MTIDDSRIGDAEIAADFMGGCMKCGCPVRQDYGDAPCYAELLTALRAIRDLPLDKGLADAKRIASAMVGKPAR